MRVRAVLAASAAVAGSLATVADAAPPRPAPKSCNLVTDPAGDVDNSPGFPASNSLDVVGADLASNATTITGVIKLANFDQGELATIVGKRYFIEFKPAGSKYPLLLAALYQPQGVLYSFGYRGTETSYSYPGTATGKVEGGVITISASLADMAAVAEVGKISNGTKITGFRAASMRRFQNVTYYIADEGFGKTSTSYTAGGASCVKVGG